MKPSDHVTRHLIEAWKRGEVTGDQLSEILLDHLEVACPPCRPAIRDGRRAQTRFDEYAGIVGRVRRAVQTRTARRTFDREAARVPRLLRSFEGLSPGQRALRIRNAPERYANRALAEELFRRARACLPSDPAGSRGWAETAEAVAALHPEPLASHAIRALAFRGNAERALGDFRQGKRLLLQARDQMEEEGLVDLDLEAELHSFLGSLFTDLRHFDEAREHLDAAVRLYLLVENDDGAARVMMQVSNLHTCSGDPHEALEADHAALSLVPRDRSPQLYLAVRLNQAVDLLEAGQASAALDILLYDEDQHENHSDLHTWTRFRWLQGRVAGEVGDLDFAEECLTEVRDEFGRQKQGFDAALVCLDLAAFYHREGRHAELRETAARAVRLFEAHEIHREALAALLLLRDATEAEHVTAETLRRVTDRLRQAADAGGARSEPES